MVTVDLGQPFHLTLENILNYDYPPFYRHFVFPRHIHDKLLENGYTHLGWLNDGITPPKGWKFKTVYRNDTGSYTFEVCEEHQAYYCVDMGD